MVEVFFAKEIIFLLAAITLTVLYLVSTDRSRVAVLTVVLIGFDVCYFLFINVFVPIPPPFLCPSLLPRLEGQRLDGDPVLPRGTGDRHHCEHHSSNRTTWRPKAAG